MEKVSRRDFLKYAGVTGGALFLGIDGGIAMSKTASRVALVKTDNRKNAVALGLGASSPSEIEAIPADENSQDYRDRILEILKKG
jgi:hypothetical protein